MIWVDYIPEKKVEVWIAIAEMDSPRTRLQRRIVS